jgi:integrase
MPKKKRRGPPLPSEVRALLRTVEDEPAWYAIFLLMLRSGLRLNEVRWLDVKDFDEEREQLMVRKSRGHSERVVPIGRPVIDAIRAHLRSRKRQNEVAMFPTQQTGRISGRYIRTTVDTRGRQAGINRHLNPDQLRPLINIDDPVVKSTVGELELGNEDTGSGDWLLPLLDAQRTLLISVAIGGVSPEQADDEYRRRQKEISTALERMGLANPFPWRSLWGWHTYYARELATHTERREYIDRLAKPLLTTLRARTTRQPSATTETWKSVDLRIRELTSRQDEATSVDDFQDVGRRSRELIIAAVNVLFNESMVPKGQIVPQGSNAKARLDILADALLAGAGGRSELRSLYRDVTRSAWNLSQTVTHSGSARRLDAIIAARTSVLLVDALRELDDDSRQRRPS